MHSGRRMVARISRLISSVSMAWQVWRFNSLRIASTTASEEMIWKRDLGEVAFFAFQMSSRIFLFRDSRVR
ncbi:MAG TPA: hypothetical protein VFD42_09010 [Chloroflexota bacterium]|nr:hypothetical protein [Chloroflexota bacterium]